MTKATELKVNDRFSQVGSSRTYTVLEVVEAHRGEYAVVLRVQSSTGKEATVAFPADSTVITK